MVCMQYVYVNLYSIIIIRHNIRAVVVANLKSGLISKGVGRNFVRGFLRYAHAKFWSHAHFSSELSLESGASLRLSWAFRISDSLWRPLSTKQYENRDPYLLVSLPTAGIYWRGSGGGGFRAAVNPPAYAPGFCRYSAIPDESQHCR